MSIIKALKAEFTIGLTPGYGHNNESNDISLDDLIAKCALEVEKETGFYVSTVIVPSKTIYKEEWGCPFGGEDTYTVQCLYNPNYDKYDKLKPVFIDSVQKLVRLLMEKLDQTTVSLIFEDALLDYIMLRREIHEK